MGVKQSLIYVENQLKLSIKLQVTNLFPWVSFSLVFLLFYVEYDTIHFKRRKNSHCFLQN